MGEKMPIEKLRDRLRELSMRDEAVTNTPDTLARWADIVDAHLTQPAQAVDVDAVRAVIEQTREYYERTDDRRTAYALGNVLSDIYETLTAALPNAQEGTPDAAR